MPIDDGQVRLYDDDDEEYDLSPDEDELDLLEEDEESDDLDAIADPGILEIDRNDVEAPQLIKQAGKGKNKRAAEDSDDEEGNLDDIMAKSLKPAEPTVPVTNGEAKLSKKQRKKLRKLNGEAAPATTTTESAKTSEPAAKEATNGEKVDKKVQFAKNLEQGPTPSPKQNKTDDKSRPSLGKKEVQGVLVDDKKLGEGPMAKKGDEAAMRYIGKLEDGKVFDGIRD